MGIFSKINFGLSKTRSKMAGAIDSLFADGGEITDDLYAELEEILVMGDVGVPTAVEITDRLRKRVAQLAPPATPPTITTFIIYLRKLLLKLYSELR